MNRSDYINYDQIEKLTQFILSDNPQKDNQVSIILSSLKHKNRVNIDWFLACMGSLAELLDDQEMLKKVKELQSKRAKAIDICLKLQEARECFERLREEAHDLAYKCDCQFSSSHWDGVESYFSCPFCFK